MAKRKTRTTIKTTIRPSKQAKMESAALEAEPAPSSVDDDKEVADQEHPAQDDGDDTGAEAVADDDDKSDPEQDDVDNGFDYAVVNRDTLGQDGPERLQPYATKAKALQAEGLTRADLDPYLLLAIIRRSK